MKHSHRGIGFLLCLALLLALCAPAGAENVLWLPASLETIEEEAFSGLQAVDQVVLPDSVKEIGSAAFAASSVKTVNFPDGITAIADDAFAGSALEKVRAKEGTYGYTWAQDRGYEIIREYPRLTWVQGTSPAPRDNEMVLAEMNRITRRKLGCEIEIIYMSNDEVAASIAAGEVYDMYFAGSWFNNFDQNVAAGVFADITEELQEVTPELYGTMPDTVWDLVKTDEGKLYGIPTKKDYAPMYFIAFDAQVAKDAGIEIPESIESLDELTPYLVALKAAMVEDPTLGDYPVVASNISGLNAGFESVQSAALIGVTCGGTQVQFMFDDETVMERYKTLHKWYEMGLVDTADKGDDYYSQRRHEISFVQAWPGYDYTPSNGYLTQITQYAGPYLNADDVKGSMVALSAALKDDPERLALCLKFLELVNTDREFRDMLAYGIPGYHFNYRDVKDEEGNTVGQVVIRTNTGKEGYTPWRFSQGSYLVNSLESNESSFDGTYPTPDVNQWEKYFAQTDAETTPVSQLSGFVFDASQFTEELAQIQAIKDEYMPGIKSGKDNPVLAVLEMHTKMQAAGLDRLIAEAQRQFNQHLGLGN